MVKLFDICRRLLHESKILGSADDSLLTKRSMGLMNGSQNAKV